MASRFHSLLGCYSRFFLTYGIEREVTNSAEVNVDKDAVSREFGTSDAGVAGNKGYDKQEG